MTHAIDKPMSREARKARRENIRQEFLAKAEQSALEVERSMRCSGRGMPYNTPRHAGDDNGCKNDGTGCICECHDPAPKLSKLEETIL